MPKPQNQKISTVFDQVADRYDQVTSPYAIKRRADFFMQNAKGRCLEVGAGTGTVALAFQKAGLKITTTDVSPKMVEEMRKKGLEAMVCDAEQLPFPDESFDTVLASEVLYYLDHPENFLAEAGRILRPDGILLLTSANAKIARFYDLLRTILRPFGVGGSYFDDPVHTFFSKKDLVQLVNKANFRNIEAKKILVLPAQSLSSLNNILEKTPLCILGAFITLKAKK